MARKKQDELIDEDPPAEETAAPVGDPVGVATSALSARWDALGAQRDVMTASRDECNAAIDGIDSEMGRIRAELVARLGLSAPKASGGTRTRRTVAEIVALDATILASLPSTKTELEALFPGAKGRLVALAKKGKLTVGKGGDVLASDTY